jgi:hypothetical protein
MRRSLLLLTLIAFAAILLMGQFDSLKAHFSNIIDPPTANSTGSPKVNSGVIELSLGQSGADVIKKSKAAIKRSQTAGLVFYESSDIENGSEPVLRLIQAQGTLELPRARSILLIADEARGQNIEDIEVSVKVASVKTGEADSTAMAICEKEIYALLIDIVARIKAAGWKRYIDPSSARIAGWASFDTSAGTKPDLDYALSFEQ